MIVTYSFKETTSMQRQAAKAWPAPGYRVPHDEAAYFMNNRMVLADSQTSIFNNELDHVDAEDDAAEERHTRSQIRCDSSQLERLTITLLTFGLKR